MWTGLAEENGHLEDAQTRTLEACATTRWKSDAGVKPRADFDTRHSSLVTVAAYL